VISGESLCVGIGILRVGGKQGLINFISMRPVCKV
jgi:hypothetical protein